MHRGDEQTVNPEVLMHNFGYRRQGVGGTRSHGNHVVCSAVVHVLMHAHRTPGKLAWLSLGQKPQLAPAI
jgi:hypothetical protein